MEDAGALRTRVFELLEGWGGFTALKSEMQSSARTEVFLAGGVMRDLYSGMSRVPRDFDFFVDGCQFQPV